MNQQSIITAIDYVGNAPTSIQLTTKFTLPEHTNPTVVVLEIVEHQKKVPIPAKVTGNSIIADMWTLTDALRKAEVLSAGGTLLSGGQFINLQSGQYQKTVAMGSVEDEILQAIDGIDEE